MCRLLCYCNLHVLWLMNPFFIFIVVWIWFSCIISYVITCKPLLGWRQHIRYMASYSNNTPCRLVSGCHFFLKANGHLALLHVYDARALIRRRLEVCTFSLFCIIVKDDSSILLPLLETVTLFLNLVLNP